MNFFLVLFAFNAGWVERSRKLGFALSHGFFMHPRLFNAHNESDTLRLKGRSTHPTALTI